MLDLILIACLSLGENSYCETHGVSGLYANVQQCQVNAALIAGASQNKLVNKVEKSFNRTLNERVYLKADAYKFGYTFTCTANDGEGKWIAMGDPKAIAYYTSDAFLDSSSGD